MGYVSVVAHAIPLTSMRQNSTNFFVMLDGSGVLTVGPNPVVDDDLVNETWHQGKQLASLQNVS